MALVEVKCPRCSASYKRMVDFISDSFWDSEGSRYYHKCYLDEGTEVEGQLNSDTLVIVLEPFEIRPIEGHFIALDESVLDALVLGTGGGLNVIATHDKDFLKKQVKKSPLNDYALYRVVDTSKQPAIVLKKVDWES